VGCGRRRRIARTAGVCRYIRTITASAKRRTGQRRSGRLGRLTYRTPTGTPILIVCGEARRPGDDRQPMTLTAERRQASPLWWAGIRLLRQRAAGALIGSNTLTSLGGGMQLLLHGWLAVAWGHSAWFLAIFAATRIVPKIVLTVPAGIVCDRVPRARLLFACRML